MKYTIVTTTIDSVGGEFELPDGCFLISSSQLIAGGGTLFQLLLAVPIKDIDGHQ